MEIVWIYYGFCGAISNLVVWISLFFSVITAETANADKTNGPPKNILSNYKLYYYPKIIYVHSLFTYLKFGKYTAVSIE
jgi:hypothetical protein